MNGSRLGVMLDCSRNAVMKVARVKDLIDKLAVMGYNCLMLYTEDTWEVNNEPLFGYMRGRYTKAELKEIDAYAFSRGIEVIPCIQTLAHLERIFQYPEYKQINDIENILLADDQRTYRLIENMFETCAECFKTRKLHIGIDEAHLLGLGKYLTLHGYENRFSILTRHLKKVCEIAEKYGFEPIMWSDMFFRLLYDGDYYGTGKEIPQEVKAQIPQNVEMCYWDYYHLTKEEYDGYIEQHQALDRPIWFAGGAWKWIGFHTGNLMSFERTKNAILSCKEHGVNNIVLTFWGDNGNESPFYAMLPTLLYTAECAKGNYLLEEIKKKFENLFGESWDDFLQCDMVLRKSSVDLAIDDERDFKKFLYNDCFLGKFDYEAIHSGWTKSDFEAYVKRFSEAKTRSKRFAYIFESYEALCKALSLKFDLGYRTRVAYQANDNESLKIIVEEYKKTIGYLKEFLESFRSMWYTDNKPHGFDVQEIRLGGTIQRLESCRERLEAYVAGKIVCIEELEEQSIDFNGGPDTRNSYLSAVTVNLI